MIRKLDQFNSLKLESCCDVIKTLLSTAMAGQDNVSAQKAFLEENGCNAGRYSACDVIILSQTDQLVQWLNTSLSVREVLGSIFGLAPVVSSVVKRTGYWCGRSGVRFPGWSNWHRVANDSPPLRRFCVTQAQTDGPQ